MTKPCGLDFANRHARPSVQGFVYERGALAAADPARADIVSASPARLRSPQPAPRYLVANPNPYGNSTPFSPDGKFAKSKGNWSIERGQV